MEIINQLQIREIFHLEFLKWFSRKVKIDFYALKGGANLRFFFKSFRYSEDMDLDVSGIRKDALLDAVMAILGSKLFNDSLNSYGIERVIPPDISRAKQTSTTQRFKLHLITYTGEDLFTKVEFSRRGFKGEIVAESVSDSVTRTYKMPPLIVPHYGVKATVEQKVSALGLRSAVQARDIFDLYILSSQCEPGEWGAGEIAPLTLKEASERVFEVSFEQFRDTVVSYLPVQDQKSYNSSGIWDEVRIKTARFLEELESKA
ncbi:MAG: nucleotidyl transferase AbiEii/AbiGii toxin family protein [Candidatus Omnitrophota bacterium]|nr:nucleotidyl transferase AbiEii/AbiGii toxin family protein [Candidatus Omnitrophota bacterium]